MTSDAAATNHSTHWSELFTIIVGATCQQGSSILLRSLSARIVLMIVFVTLMFLHTRWGLLTELH